MNEPVIPLQAAFMCADEVTGPHISTNPHRCPICSSQVFCLARALDRQQKETQCTN